MCSLERNRKLAKQKMNTHRLGAQKPATVIESILFC